jgi:hypothetical protein
MVLILMIDLDESSELFTENGLDFNFQIFSRK